MRTFLAIELPNRLKRALADLRRHLPTDGADVRWLAPESTHLTVKFLGSTPPDRAGAVADAIAEVAARHRPLSLRLIGGGAFPARGAPKVLWVGVDGELEPLAALATDLSEALVPLGFEPEDRPYRPHVTVGRVKSGRPRAAVDALRELGEVGELPVNELVWFESLTLPTGAVYTPLRKLTLGQPHG